MKHIFKSIFKKEKKDLIVHSYDLGQRAALRDARSRIEMNDGVNKVAFNINSHCFSILSHNTMTFTLGNSPKIDEC